MKVKWIVTTSLYFKMVVCLVYKSEDGVTLKYSVQFGNACWSEKGRFAILYGLSIGECVKECGLRKHCNALNFKRRLNVCELFSTDEGADVHKGGCIRVLSEDIEVIQNTYSECNYGKVWDTTIKQCIRKECVSLGPLEHGKILGNKRNIGSKIQFKCDSGYSLENETSVAECTTLGSWTATAKCVIDTPCGELPHIPNGTAVRAEGSSDVQTATVICDLWYQTRNSEIMCTATGDWENATCADCYLSTTQEYQGKRNSTRNGTPCKRWEDMSPHNYHDVDLLPDDSVSDAKNYCRNPNSNSWLPWCYTTFDHEWDYCGIKACV